MSVMVDLRTLAEDVAETWGVDAQMGVLAEECAELIVALHHYGRGKCEPANVVEEIADVMLAAELLAHVFVGGAGTVDQVKARKASRLVRRIKRSGGHERWVRIKSS